MSLSRLDQLISGAIRELLADERSEFVKCLHPRSEYVEAVVLELLGFTQPGPQPVPLPGRHHTDPDESVAAFENRIQILVPRPSPPSLSGLAGRRGLTLGSERWIQCHHHRVEPGEVDVIAGAATQSVEVRDQHRPGCLH